MKTINQFTSLLVILFFLASCSSKLSYFTQDLYEQYHWSPRKLEQIQFYLSRDIVLKKQRRGGSSEIAEGKIKVKDGRKVEVITIRKGTPGVYLFSPKEKRFAISFEAGKNKRFLMFGPNPKADDRYVLLASDWKRRTGKVNYDGKEWRVNSEDAYAALMVDLKEVRRVSVKSRTARGHKIN
jgi:hypothetical protein